MSILGRRLSAKVVMAWVGAMVCAGGLIPVLTEGAPTHEFELVAKDMAFYAGSDGAANPVLEVRAGETVRVVLKNLDRGMMHDFAVPAVGAATEPVSWNDDETITFEAPKNPGTYEYVCRPHLAMMKGTLRVTQ